MEITYTWQFNPLECYPTASGETDVVFRVHWQAYANTGSYNASCIGVENVPLPSGSVFVPFENLTKEIVQGWVETAMGPERVAAITTSLASQIENQINPPVLTLTSPWLSLQP
jgi:hypothetical protein